MNASRPVVIAHRGASGYLPEHSLGAKALAYAMRADYLEQDVIATRDGRLVVLHDLTLDAVTDVAQHFPTRRRGDGHYYVRDFDLDELRTLRFHERIDPVTGRAFFPRRFPPSAGACRIVTFAEEMRWIAALNNSTGRDVGIYPEIKDPGWHANEGFDLAGAVVDELDVHGWLAPGRPIFLQCFDAATLRTVRERVGPSLALIQLIADDATDPVTIAGAATQYANGVGPSLGLLCSSHGDGRAPQPTVLAEQAQRLGLAIHAYTFRADALPAAIKSFETLLALFVNDIGIDGLFTDFPDRALHFLDGGRTAQPLA